MHIHGVEGRWRFRSACSPSHLSLAACNCPLGEFCKAVDATVNTLNNSCHETMVDGMARTPAVQRRLRYQLHAVGGPLMKQRCRALSHTVRASRWTYFLNSCGLRPPQVDGTAAPSHRMGTDLDHSVGFNFDCYYHYLHRRSCRSAGAFPRLGFYHYLKNIRRRRACCR